MLGLNDQQYSSDEGNDSSTLTGSPLGRTHYDPIRHTVWTSGQFPSMQALSQHGSPAGTDFPSRRLSFEGYDVELSPVGTSVHDHPLLPSLYQSRSSSTAERSPPLPSDAAHRSVPDRTLAGPRPHSQEFQSSFGNISATGRREHDVRTSEPTDMGTTSTRYPSRPRPPYSRDEFDGPSQLLPLPLPEQEQNRAQALPQLPVNLSLSEQDEVARRANDILSHCAFHFVAKYQFPIPIERDKRSVRQASDREWTEWAYLLKRLATKRRIPARLLFDGQIKQLVTTLENSIAVRQTINVRVEPPAPRQPRDDRYMLQLVSSGLQVAKLLMDSMAMEQLDQLYLQTEALILERRGRLGGNRGGIGPGHVPRGSRDSIGRSAGSGLVVGSGSSGAAARALPGY